MPPSRSCVFLDRLRAEPSVFIKIVSMTQRNDPNKPNTFADGGYMRRRLAGLLLVFLALPLCLYRLLPEAEAGTVLDRSQRQETPQVPTPKPNPNVLKTDPALSKTPSFEIGFVIPSRAGFQQCSSPAGYQFSLSPKGQSLRYPREWSQRYCAQGNVTVTQTNPLINLTGKTLRLWVKRDEIGWVYTSPWDVGTIDAYELPFQQKYTLTFQVVFASGWKATPTTNNLLQENIAYLSDAFASPKPLKFFAQYLDPSTRDEQVFGAYPVLQCWFSSFPANSVPPPNKVDCDSFSVGSPLYD